MPPLITKSVFAAHLSVTRPRITALIKRGLPVEAGGKIDVEAAEAWLRNNVVPQARFGDRGVFRVAGGPRPPEKPAGPPARRGRPPAPTPPGSFNLLSEKARETHFRADKAELDFKERDGQLLDAVTVRREWESIIADSRGRVLACPSRIAARLPHLTRHCRDQTGDHRRLNGAGQCPQRLKSAGRPCGRGFRRPRDRYQTGLKRTCG